MATVHFYEKPGCATNTRQKQLLAAAGHEVVAYDLLSQPWKEQLVKLRTFFGERPVFEWFNVNAPAIKYGEIDPLMLNAEQALGLMQEQPLLIRRPLIEVNGHCFAGFDVQQVEAALGLSLSAEQERCSHSGSGSGCAT